MKLGEYKVRKYTLNKHYVSMQWLFVIFAHKPLKVSIVSPKIGWPVYIAGIKMSEIRNLCPFMAEFWSCENCTNIWMVWMVKPSQIPDGTLQKCIKIRKVQNQSNRLCEMIIFSQQLANYKSLHCMRKWFGSNYLKQSSWKPDQAIIRC